MEVTLAAGGVIDLATAADLEEHHRRLERLVPETPRGRYYMIAGNGVTASGFAAPAAGLGIAVAFTPSSPPGGRLWFLQWVAVFVGLNPAQGAQANVFAAICVGRSFSGPSQTVAPAQAPNLGDIVVPGQAVPAAINVPDKTVVKAEQQLYALLQGSGLAASTAYNLVAGVVDVPDQDEVYFW